jgi:hypothetical protein
VTWLSQSIFVFCMLVGPSEFRWIEHVKFECWRRGWGL